MLKHDLGVKKWFPTREWSERAKTFARNEDGNFTYMTAMGLVMLLIGGGIAMDTAEIYRAKINFQNAVDSATLAAAKQMASSGDTTEAENAGQAMFFANIANLNPGENEANITFDFGPNQNCVTDGVKSLAQLDHPIWFDSIHNNDAHSNREGYVKLAAEATVECGAPRLEIAMVLDNSGSMADDNKIGTLRSASTDLVQKLFSSMGEPKAAERIKFAVIPFASTVNVGTQYANASWMDTRGISSIHHTLKGDEKIFDWEGDPGVSRQGDEFRNNTTNATMTRFQVYQNIENVSWGGCVVKRPYPHHVRDTQPADSNPDTLFVPSFAPDTPDNWDGKDEYEFAANVGDKAICESWQSRYRRNGRERAERKCRRWSDGLRERTHPQDPSYTPSRNDLVEYQDGNYIGPEVTQSGSIYQPSGNDINEKYYYNNYLADDFNFPTEAELPAGLAHPKLEQYTSTNQHVRQSWGWKYRVKQNGQRPEARDVDNDRDELPYVLNLQGGPNMSCTTQPMIDLTDDEDAIVATLQSMQAEGATDVPHGLGWGWRALSPSEPLTQGRDYNSPDNRKVIILMTDGNNTYYPISLFNQFNADKNKSLYGAYEFASNERIFDGYSGTAQQGHSFDTYRNAMDAHLLETCINAKQAGIQIYSIAFDIPNGSSVKAMLEQCATTTPGGETFYYDANDNAALVKTFDDIAEKLAALSITK